MPSSLSYPVGPFERPSSLTPAERKNAVDSIAVAPKRLRDALSGLTEEQLDTPYRPDGWTVRQVAHHVPDSHMNAYIRFKLALTEDNPTIKPYEEAEWAKLEDVHATPIATSLALLDHLHARWDTILRAMTPSDFARTLYHPDSGQLTLDQMLALYEWHGRHHVAHVTSLRERNGW